MQQRPRGAERSKIAVCGSGIRLAPDRAVQEERNAVRLGGGPTSARGDERDVGVEVVPGGERFGVHAECWVSISLTYQILPTATAAAQVRLSGSSRVPKPSLLAPSRLAGLGQRTVRRRRRIPEMLPDRQSSGHIGRRRRNCWGRTIRSSVSRWARNLRDYGKS